MNIAYEVYIQDSESFLCLWLTKPRVFLNMMKKDSPAICPHWDWPLYCFCQNSYTPLAVYIRQRIFLINIVSRWKERNRISDYLSEDCHLKAGTDGKILGTHDFGRKRSLI